MQKPLDFLKKINNPLTYAIALCTVGLAFIILPNFVIDIVMMVIGALLIASAVLTIALSGEGTRGSLIDLFLRRGVLLRSLLVLILGIVLITVRSSVSETVLDVLGGVIGLYALFKLIHPSHSTASRNFLWWVRTVWLIILIFIGIVLFLFPIWPKITAGIAALAVGIKLIFDAVGRNKAAGEEGRSDDASGKSGDYYTDDFVDKSE